MVYKYFPHTQEDIDKMLQVIGANSLDDLYAELPDAVRFKGDYDIPSEKSELEIRSHFDTLGAKNQTLTCFAGAGVYDHYTPSVIPTLVERSEFLTSYTPYQAEISQGTLHYIFEFQSMMAELTGMDISNASMYDGTTATAEAVLMMFNASKKADTVLVSKTLDPKTIAVIKTYAHFHGVKLLFVEESDGVTSLEDLKQKLSQANVAGVVVQQPNYYGIIEDFSELADVCHQQKALLTINSVASDLALLKTPGEWGADIAVGDIQSLGIPMSFGGPYAGYMCTTEKLMRKLPGRIVGMTKDNKGQRAFVLTLQAREQHIRRQKATSNICSNESLMALYSTIYMAIMGKQGLKEVAQTSFDAAHFLLEQLEKTGKFHLTYHQPFFNEFLVTYDGDLNAFYKKAIDAGILPGVIVDQQHLLIAVTEKRTKKDIELLISLI